MNHDFSNSVRESLESYLNSISASHAKTREVEKSTFQRLIAATAQSVDSPAGGVQKTVQKKKKTENVLRPALDKTPPASDSELAGAAEFESQSELI